MTVEHLSGGDRVSGLLRCGDLGSAYRRNGSVSRVSPVQTVMRNCTRDEGRPFEAGSQVLASNRCKLLSSRAMVVSVAVNVGRISWRVRLREASASESLMNCPKRIRRCQNRRVTLPPGSPRENPEACPSGIRHVGGARAARGARRQTRSRGLDVSKHCPIDAITKRKARLCVLMSAHAKMIILR
jgi:hypothetical protein